MSLLQIHDPAGKPKAIGIDLGTTHSLVAYVTSTGEPTVVTNCDLEALIPSVVHYRSLGTPIVGTRARELAVDFPEDTIVSAKRFMGRGARDAEVARQSMYHYDEANQRLVQFRVAGEKSVSAVEVSAEILRELKSMAEDEVGPVGGAVITVPAYFDDAQRQATKDAAKLAGLEVLRLLNEPTAAAVAYGLEKKLQGNFAVYDLGGGTFDITVLSLEDGVFQVRSVGGDTALGGDDMDRALAECLAKTANLAHAVGRAELMEARRIKHELSETHSATATFSTESQTHSITVSRDDFSKCIEGLLSKTGNACRRALRDAAMTPKELQGVILVGGSTRVPAVRAFVANLFEQEPMCSVDPDLVVAMGAALQADMLSGSQHDRDLLLLDVLPLSLGIESMGGVVERILPRNTAIPCEATQSFTTYADNQTGFELHVVQGERELSADNRSLAKFTLKGIPPMAAGLPRLEIKFRVDADGLLEVFAKERVSGVEQVVEIKPSYGLSDSEIEAMLNDAYEHGEADIHARALAERKTEASRTLKATRKALLEDRDLLDSGELNVIEQAIQALEKSLNALDAKRIQSAAEDLERATHAFAGRRMDRSIQGALRGQAVAGVEAETAHAKGVERAHEV